MAEEEKSKYGAEVQHFILLFQILGRSVAGLLLLEIGWTLLLVLAARFATSEGGRAPRIQLPLPGLTDVAMSAVWAVGVLGVFCGWVLYSRLYAYIGGPLLVVLKPIVDILFVVLVALVTLLDLLLRPVVTPLHRWSIQRWSKQFKAKKTDEFKADLAGGPGDANAAYSQWVEALERKHGKDVLDQIAANEVRIKPDPLSALIGPLGEVLLIPLHSGLRVGLAPMANFRWPGGLVTARATTDIFGVTVAAVRALLRDVPGIEYVSLYSVPTTFVVSTDRRAGVVRQLFNLDILVWGRFSDRDPDSATAFIARRRALISDSNEQSAGDKLFPYRNEMIDLRAVTFSSTDSVEVHLLLVLSALFALRIKQQRSRQWFSSWDRMRLYSKKISDALEWHLVFDLLPLIANKPVPDAVIPSVRFVAAEVCGRWVGLQLSDQFTRDDELWDSIGEHRFRGQLRRVVEQCLAITPSRADIWYRLGALSCLSGDADAAQRAFAEAGRLDLPHDSVNHLLATAEVTLTLAERKTGRELDLAFTRFASETARIINSGDEFARRQLKKIIDDSPTVQSLRKRPDKMPAGLAFVEDLISHADR